ncbi:LysE family translocator [Cocleimonas sp. KMM 6892]|uniref:LysE family translocator n=1 Tax=unclassified Cocleimonas TaxID=2639732 RepID=UPI002DB73ED8|nr:MULTISPECIES: LysE family translocator [unclassified Cocleimonas]MEB8434548.1 LysE family translocator [Cocleimonas sp. KMM 6892]MEC4717441.1 LysE family translocator [Cocleimonas sp. KMM 6895]MEC4746765.1 LysE family translocator [Cocleimonas sp. KMM 6896]
MNINDYLFIVPIILANLLGVMSPGPSFIFIAQRTLTTSRKHGLISALGLGTGAAIFAILSCLGLFVILEAAPFLYGALKIFGGLYLLFLAYRIWNSSKGDDSAKSGLIDNGRDKDISISASYFLGLMTQLSNPKTAIVIGSIIMAFLPTETPPYTFIIITVLMFLSDWAWYSIVVVALSTKSAQKAYNRFKKSINRVASGLLAFMGAKLAFNL